MKNILVVVLFFSVIALGTMLYMNRIDKINSGEMALIHDNQMDR